MEGSGSINDIIARFSEQKGQVYWKWTLDQRLSLMGVIDAYLIARLYHFVMVEGLGIRVGPQVEKLSNLHITADSTGSIHENVRGKKFDPKKIRLGWGDLI